MSPTAVRSLTWLTEADCDLDTFRSLVEQTTDAGHHPLADRVEQNVPVYDSDRLRILTTTPEGRRTVQGELVR
ncbi:phytanoyl-CoA dioxygenase, partial [Streptomyces asoensis]